MLCRSAVALSILTVAAVAPLRAQQAPDSVPALDSVSAAAQGSASASRPAAVFPQPARSTSGLLGPRLSPQFQSVQPRLAAGGNEGSSLMAASGSTTITISTLTLVLIIIIIVLLV